LVGTVFAHRRQARAQRARRAASEPETLAELLCGWRFCRDPALTSLVWEVLRSTPLRPSPLAQALSFAPLDSAPDGADLTEVQHRVRLAERWGEQAPELPASPLDARAWALDALGWLGEETEEVERGAWLRADWDPSPEDAERAAMWRRLPDGGFWSDRGRWTHGLMGDVVSVFRQVIESRQLPSEVARRAIADLRDVLPYKLAVGGKAAGGLVQIGARVLETGPAGPLVELLDALPEGGRRAAGHCLSRRGHWPDTLSQLFPRAAPSERALRCVDWLLPASGESLLDLHVVLRLLERWGEQDAGDPGTDWAVVVQNRGRSRGRLRALLCDGPSPGWMGRFLSWPALAHRTRAATRRWAWEWAWEELALDFSFDAGRPVGVPCRQDGEGPVPLEGEEIEILEVWVLRVILRGRLAHLRRWVDEGSTGDHDATWGRLLVEIPDALRDAGSGRYGRVRAHLVSELSSVLQAHRPLLAALAALPEGRSAMAQFRALTEPHWHAAVPVIASGLPSVRRFAAEAWALGTDTVSAEET
jgi:hypothetical protein